MRKIASLLVLSALFASSTLGKTLQEWKKRTVYQIVTDRFAKGDRTKPTCDLTSQPNYCGGDWDGITINMDYIKNLGFDAIWISPVIDNTANGYDGYWARNFDLLNVHFGNDVALKKLVDTAH